MLECKKSKQDNRRNKYGQDKVEKGLADKRVYGRGQYPGRNGLAVSEISSAKFRRRRNSIIRGETSRRGRVYQVKRTEQLFWGWNRGKLEATFISQHGAGNEDEQNAQGGGGQESDSCSYKGTLVQEFSNIGFANWSPVHKGVFTVSQERHDGIHFVLVGYDEI